MLPVINHRAVNWVDGMKISKRHFQAFEDFTTDVLRDTTASLTPAYAYGLLPTGAHAPKSFGVFISLEPLRQIHLRVTHCRAITANGSRVEVVDAEQLHLVVSQEEFFSQHSLSPTREQVMYAGLSVNPFAHVPVGEPAIDEMPPRHPFTQPEYRLWLLPQEQINTQSIAASAIVLGKIHYANGELRVDSRFLPPCAAVNAHPILLEWFQTFRQLLGELEIFGLRILQKIRVKSQPNSLSDSVKWVVETLVLGLAQDMMAFRWMMPHQPPIYFATFLLNQVQNLRTAVFCLSSKDKEELLTYFGEWVDLTAVAIEAKISGLLNQPYNHLDLSTLLTEVEDFYRLFVGLFNKLSQLEFIGRRKGQNVFVIENPVAEPNKAPPPPPPQDQPVKKPWSPIA
jgi:hypothetical protein